MSLGKAGQIDATKETLQSNQVHINTVLQKSYQPPLRSLWRTEVLTVVQLVVSSPKLIKNAEQFGHEWRRMAHKSQHTRLTVQIAANTHLRAELLRILDVALVVESGA